MVTDIKRCHQDPRGFFHWRRGDWPWAAWSLRTSPARRRLSATPPPGTRMARGACAGMASLSGGGWAAWG